MSDDGQAHAPKPEQQQAQPLPQPDPALSVKIQNGETNTADPGTIQLIETPRAPREGE